MLIVTDTNINNSSSTDSFVDSIDNELLILDNLIVHRSVRI